MKMQLPDNDDNIDDNNNNNSNQQSVTPPLPVLSPLIIVPMMINYFGFNDNDNNNNNIQTIRHPSLASPLPRPVSQPDATGHCRLNHYHNHHRCYYPLYRYDCNENHHVPILEQTSASHDYHHTVKIIIPYQNQHNQQNQYNQHCFSVFPRLPSKVQTDGQAEQFRRVQGIYSNTAHPHNQRTRSIFHKNLHNRKTIYFAVPDPHSHALKSCHIEG